MRRFFILSIISALSAATFAHASTLASRVDAILQSKAPNLSTGIEIRSANTGNILYAHHARRYFTPASNTKLFTAAAALIKLGPDFHFDTTLSRAKNNIYLRFVGDPTFTNKDLYALLAKLKQHHITRIQGDLVIDNTTFTGPALPIGWSKDDLPYCYAAPIDSIIINQNCTYISLFKHGSVAIPSHEANLPIKPAGQVALIPGTNSPKTCVFHITDHSNNLVVFGGCLPDRKTWGFPIAIPNPNLYASSLVHQDLNKLDITLAGHIRFAKQPAQTTVIATHTSDSLAAILGVMLKESNNVYAGAITKTLGNAYYSVGSHKAGANAIDAILHKAIGKAFTPPYLEGGAGGSVYNQITPNQLTQLLFYMYHSHYKTIWLRDLAVSGESGTMSYRLSDKIYRGKVLAKTGSMSGVSTLSGYLLRHGHTPIVFSIMMNGIRGSLNPKRRIQDLIVQKI